jgi:hypothetical protein
MSEHTGIKGKTPHALARANLAAARKTAREARTTDEQLAQLNQRPGNSERERGRLQAARIPIRSHEPLNPTPEDEQALIELLTEAAETPTVRRRRTRKKTGS